MKKLKNPLETLEKIDKNLLTKFNANPQDTELEAIVCCLKQIEDSENRLPKEYFSKPLKDLSDYCASQKVPVLSKLPNLEMILVRANLHQIYSLAEQNYVKAIYENRKIELEPRKPEVKAAY